MEFQLPDGAWDNSWGTRNYKWSWWGSRTSDGCQPGFLLMAGHDPRFREAARRNTELMAACTDDGLVYAGPDYKAHGDLPCIHHTFTHAKALAAALDRGSQMAREERCWDTDSETDQNLPKRTTQYRNLGSIRRSLARSDSQPATIGGI